MGMCLCCLGGMQVHTDYVFHCEDDWVFNGMPGFVADSVAILHHEAKISTVRPPEKYLTNVKSFLVRKNVHNILSSS